MSTIHITIIGMGPRGLSVLERVLRHAQHLPVSVALQVDIVDPGKCGQGCHPADQADHLLINTVGSQITIFGPDSGDGALSLVEWTNAHGYRRVGRRFERTGEGLGAEITDQDHLPRSLLGEYLGWAFDWVARRLPPRVRLMHHRARVVDVGESAGGFEVTRDDGMRHWADYVFLTTGHGKRRPTEEDRAHAGFVERVACRNRRLAYFGTAYPTARLGGIAADATVAVQGFGLTAHDVISTLTVGRGGQYVEVDGRLRYVRSGREPRLLLFSRNCLPFAARATNQKGLTGKHQARFFTTAAVHALRARARTSGDARIDFVADVLPLVKKEMAYAHRCAALGCEVDPVTFAPSPEEVRTIDEILWPLAGRRFDSFAEFRAFFDCYFLADLAEAFKGNRTSPVKAATDVLRDTREALRAAVEYAGLTPESHRFFVEDFNAVTNRISFGPPKQRNVELVALREAGLVDIAGGPGARVFVDDERAAFRIEAHYPSGVERSYADVLIVARLDNYSPVSDDSPLTESLMRRGLVRPFANCGYHPSGIDVDAQLHPLRQDGRAQLNAWVIGFPIEGPHFYTHALPRPQITSRQTVDAERCVLELFSAIAAREVQRPTAPAAHAAATEIEP